MFLRKERDPQLLVISDSTTGKSKFIKQLLSSLNFKYYTTDSDDFTGYQDNLYDLIFLDEFNYKRFSRNFLLKLLGGSGDLSYSGKYLETEIKKDNLPVIMALNP